MKKIVLVFIGAVLFACSERVDEQAEIEAIKNLMEKESNFAAAADLEAWSNCWVNSDEASFIFTNHDGSQKVSGFSNIKEFMSGATPFELQLDRSNYHFSIGDDLAFVTYDQTDNWGGAENSKKSETRTLRKVDGEWKIVNTTVIDLTSYAHPETPSFHMPAKDIPPRPGSGFTNIQGIAGVSVGYVDIPAGTDFSPLFKGLPHDMCGAPHWGYLIEGSIYVLYADGSRDSINAGEVFYLPALHTGGTLTGAKFIDFSPDEAMNEMLDQASKNIAAMQASK